MSEDNALSGALDGVAEVVDFTGAHHQTKQAESKWRQNDDGTESLDYDLTKAPPVIRGLVEQVAVQDIAEVRREAAHQWPKDFLPETNDEQKNLYEDWPEEKDERARERVAAACVGVALGVHVLAVPAITPVLKAAVEIDRGIKAALKRADDKKAATAAKRAETRKANRAKNKAARKTKKANR